MNSYKKTWLISTLILTGFVPHTSFASDGITWKADGHIKTDTSKNNRKEKGIDLLKYVNTLQGTDNKFEFSHGRDVPCVGFPHGVSYWSPRNYEYNNDTIKGFGQGDAFTLMPLSGALDMTQNKNGAPFNHAMETGKPNYYKVTFKNGITTQFAPTWRCAYFQFSFPKSKEAYLVMNAFTEISEVKIDASQHRITGYVTTAASGFMQIEGWKEYKSYFILQFNQPFISFGTWENSSGNISKNKSADQGNGIGAYVAFKKGTTVDVKVTLSHISMEQAEITLNKELGTVSNFNEVKEVAGKAWNDALKQILVEGGTESQRETFYSCLFRASRYPANEYELDQNGSAHYYNLDDGKVHDGYHYFSPIFWDGFRCLFALQNILHPTFIGQYVQSLLPAYKISGWFPYGGIMIGNNIMSVFAEAWSKGIRTFNPDSVLKAYLQEVMHSKPVPILDPNRGKGRPGYTDYFTLGYVSFPQGERKNLETTSRTLEFAYNDFCAYQLAKMTHNTFYEKIFERSMYNYKNVFDTKDHFMKGRDADGNWDKSFNPYQWGGAFVEGNSWQWTWSVFHDVQGLINLMGGDRSFITKLDSLFAAPSDSVLVGGYGFMIHEINEAVEQKLGQYAGGNEPCFHVGYLYDYCGQPWKTQQFLRLSMNKLFNAGPDGYPGDLDMGATAAWYVLSALGIYSVTPGTNQYVIGSPLFDKATITMEDGKQFVIKADHNNASNVYIQNALLNGRTYNHNWITYDDIVNGGVLHFDMGADPNLKRGIEKEDRPFSVSAARQ